MHKFCFHFFISYLTWFCFFQLGIEKKSEMNKKKPENIIIITMIIMIKNEKKQNHIIQCM
jgi:hypothetical protein